MQKIFAIGAISAAALCALFGASNASAQSVNLNFNGMLTSGTCTLSVAGGSGTTVTLPTISVTSFNPTGVSTAGRTRFALTLSACGGTNSAGQNITVAVPYFDYTSATVNPSTNNLHNGSSGTASGVELRLLDGVSTDQILLSAAPTTTAPAAGTLTAQNVTVASIAGTTGSSNQGAASIPLYVEYYATGGQPGAGSVTNYVPITMQYN